jgi:hypothetical protein
MTANVVLYWPLEAPDGEPLASEIVEITSSLSSSLTITVPDATQVSVGQTILFNNLSGYNISVKNQAGSTILSVTAGTQWQVYLYDNTTAAGGWRVYQFGATTSTANAGALAGAGLKANGSTLETTIPQTNITINTTLTSASRARLYNWNGALGVITLPVAATVGNNWYCHIRNSGSGSVTVSPPGAEQINETTTLVFNPGDSATIVTDGTDFYSIGFGQNATFAFDYTVINVSGNTNYTLSGTELNRIAYLFVGAITANIKVIVPNTVQQYWVNNSTTGAYTLSIGTAAQISPLIITQGTSTITYCDATNVVAAVTAFVTGTISGGTF